MRSSVVQVSSLPGPAEQCAKIAESLAGGRNVIAQTGRYLEPDEFRDAIIGSHCLQRFACVGIVADDVSPPVRQLSERLEVDIELLLAGGRVEVPIGYIVFVDALDGANRRTLDGWYELVRRYSTTCHGLRSEGTVLPSLLLCLTGSAEVHSPSDTVMLEHVRLYRSIDGLDLRCLVRARAGGGTDAKSVWREHILPALAGPEPDLIERCWDACLDGVNALEPIYAEVAAARGWRPSTSPRAPTNDDLDTELTGTHFIRRGGARVPHLAWAFAWDGPIEIERRLWRGQASFLLPYLDLVRLALCERLQDSLGPGWALRFLAPLDEDEHQLVRESHLHCQFGHLQAVIVTAPRTRDRRTLLPVAAEARRMRNELAHYRAISFMELSSLLRNIEAANLACDLGEL